MKRQKGFKNQQTHIDESCCEFFIGGINGRLSESQLSKYFKVYGNVKSTSIIKNRKTGLTSGFGFLRIRLEMPIQQFLSIKHIIGNILVDVQPSLDRGAAKQKAENERIKKIFVGGLPKNFTDGSLKHHFAIFGEIERAYVVKDCASGKTRGFGFVIFREIESVANVLDLEEFIIEGKIIHIKCSVSKEEIKKSQNQNLVYPIKDENLKGKSVDKRPAKGVKLQNRTPVLIFSNREKLPSDFIKSSNTMMLKPSTTPRFPQQKLYLNHDPLQKNNISSNELIKINAVFQYGVNQSAHERLEPIIDLYSFQYKHCYGKKDGAVRFESDPPPYRFNLMKEPLKPKTRSRLPNRKVTHKFFGDMNPVTRNLEWSGGSEALLEIIYMIRYAEYSAQN